MTLQKFDILYEITVVWYFFGSITYQKCPQNAPIEKVLPNKLILAKNLSKSLEDAYFMKLFSLSHHYWLQQHLPHSRPAFRIRR